MFLFLARRAHLVRSEILVVDHPPRVLHEPLRGPGPRGRDATHIRKAGLMSESDENLLRDVNPPLTRASSLPGSPGQLDNRRRSPDRRALNLILCLGLMYSRFRHGEGISQQKCTVSICLLFTRNIQKFWRPIGSHVMSLDYC